MEGFDVVGVEIVPKIAALYKHPCIIADVRTLDGRRFQGFDLIVGSPPCRDFSTLSIVFGYRWKDPPDPEGRGMSMVNAFLRVVKEAEPTYWLMENVPNLKNYIDIPPQAERSIGKGMRRCFWGNFPSFLIPRDYRHDFMFGARDKLRPWLRSRIPLPVARALGRAVAISFSV